MTVPEPLIALTAYCRTSTDDQQNPEEACAGSSPAPVP